METLLAFTPVIAIVVLIILVGQLAGKAAAYKQRSTKLRAQVYESLDAIKNLSMIAEQVYKAKIGDKDEQAMLGGVVDEAWEALHPRDRAYIAYGGIYREEATRWQNIGRSRRGSVSAAKKKGSPRLKRRPRKDSRRK